MPFSLDALAQDLRYSVRGLKRSPVFAVAAVVVCALGIGATTAVFSIVDRILFRPLAFGDEAGLVSVGLSAPLDKHEFMFADGYFALRREKGPLAAVTAFQAGKIPCDLTENHPLRLDCLRIEASFLKTLGVAPFAGREFSREEDRPDGRRVAMISHGLWRSRFGSDPAVIGKTFMLDGVSTQVVGVTPAGFETPTRTRADILLPLALNEARERAGRALRVFGRLQPGRTAQSARAELEPYFQRALEQVPPRFRKEVGLRVQPLRDRQYGEYRQISIALFGAVLAVLLIACANIANLLLARSLMRDRELAMRIALGASRMALARQALVESLVVAGAGGVLGCGLAYGLLRVIASLAPAGVAGLDEAAIDLRVLIVAVAASVATGLIAGIAPALRTPRDSQIGGWKDTGGDRSWMRTGLVTAQIAASLVLLASAGLLLRSLWNLERVATGLESDRVMTAGFVLSPHRYQNAAQQLAFFNDLSERLKALPGVESAAISDSLPPSGGTRGRPLSTIEVEGEPPIPSGTGGMVSWRYVSPGYFSTMRIPIKEGRAFDSSDQGANVYSMVLSESLARRVFHGGEAVGRRVLKGPNGEWFTVTGVAGDVKNQGLEKDAAPEYYVVRKAVPDVTFANQEPPVGWRGAHIVLRSSLDPGLVSASVRQMLESMDATLPVKTETLDQRLGEVKQQPRFNAAVLAAFAGTGVLIAAAGLFGVLSFLVMKRTREIGVRMALGATPGAIVGAVLRQAAWWVAPGVVLGVLGTAWTARFLQTLLFGIEPLDPIAVAGATAVLGIVAVAAAAGPARRASRVDPMVSLREE